MSTDIMGFQCSTPGAGCPKFSCFLISSGIQNKKSIVFGTAGLNGLSHYPDTGIFGWLTGGIS